MPFGFCVKNLGCKVNRVESDSFIQALVETGAQQVSPADADLIIVNTCAVTGEAETKTRKAVRRALKEAPSAQIFVTGCSAILDAEVYRQMGGRIQVFPLRTQCLEAALSYMEGAADSSCQQDSQRGILWSSGVRSGKGYPTRMAVKVQDGCNNACSYCVVHIARGPSVSRPLGSCLQEVTEAFGRGVHEIVLTGVDLGCYQDGGADLLVLLQKMLDAMPDQSARIRLSSIEPMAFQPELARLISQSEGRICAHLHLPLQSGCSRTLKEMNRPYSVEDFRQLVQEARVLAPNLALTTDVIVGFPGETEEDFQASYDFCKEMAFSRMHVFRYSKRPGTPAAQRPDQLDPKVIADRAARLRQLSAELTVQDALKRTGTHEKVLIEVRDDSGFAGTSESYHRVHVPDDPGINLGDLLEVELLSLSGTPTIMGEDESPLLEGCLWKPIQ